MKKFRGFTLAEVLIVVAIIGVVAALVLPTVFNKVNSMVLENHRKKAMSTLANGVKMFTAQNVANPYLKDTAIKRCGEDKQCIAAEVKKVFKVMDDNLSSNDTFDTAYTFVGDSSEVNVWQDNRLSYIFSTTDGTTYGIMQNGADRRSLLIIADTNGADMPNEGGTDLCEYEFDETGHLITDTSACVLKAYSPQICSVTNLSACNQAQCESLVSTFDYRYVWFGGSCQKEYLSMDERK